MRSGPDSARRAYDGQMPPRSSLRGRLRVPALLCGLGLAGCEGHIAGTRAAPPASPDAGRPADPPDAARGGSGPLANDDAGAPARPDARDVCTDFTAGSGLRYCLSDPARVSLAIYDRDDNLVRTLMSGVDQAPGVHGELWDGLDDGGRALPAGDYHWRLLGLPGPFQARFLMAPGDSYPRGAGWWEGAPGNHQGSAAVAVDDTGFYIGAGVAENVTSYLKLARDGETRLWSAPQPAVSRGAVSIAALQGRLLLLQQDGYIAVHPDSTRGRPFCCEDVAHWDVLWPGDDRGTDAVPSLGLRDLAAAEVAGRAQLVVSDHAHDVVRWLDPTSGQEVDRATVARPTGVAVDREGRVLVLSGTTVLRLDRTTKTPVVVVSGLTEPYRLDVDRGSGDIVVVDRGASQQIKRFASDGRALASYGRAGGRAFGLYHAEDFLDVDDIAADGEGGFVIAEAHHSPRRTAWFDSKGKLRREWMGGQRWTPTVSVTPGDPSVVWTEGHYGELMRFVLDLSARTWTLHSVYSLASAGGLVETNSIEAWKVRRHGNATYLVHDGRIEVVRVDERKWSLVPCAVGEFGQGVGGNVNAWLWTDDDGAGQVDAAERRDYPGWGLWSWERASLQSDEDFGYTYYSANDNEQRVYRVEVKEWNAAGCPVYEDLKQHRPLSARTPEPTQKMLQTPAFARDGTGTVYGALNFDADGWAAARSSRMMQWRRDGSLRWVVGRRSTDPTGVRTGRRPGELFTNFRRNWGVVRDVVVATDYNGGWNGAPPAMTYAWDKDGLWAGALFERVALDAAPLALYTLSSDDLAGDVAAGPTPNQVLVYGAHENEVRVFQVDGWQGWQHRQGDVRLAAPGAAKPGLLVRPLDPPAAGAPDDFTVGVAAGVVVPANQKASGWVWSGTMTPPRSDRYTFTLRAQGTARVWVDGREVAESLNADSSTGHAELTANRPSELQVEYRVTPGAAADISLEVRAESGGKERIEPSNFRPARVPAPGASFARVPGRIAAADYNLGGPMVGFFDSTPPTPQAPGGFRNDGVELIDYDDPQAPPPGFLNHRADLTTGEWLAYTVVVPTAGRFRLTAQVSSAAPSVPAGTMHVMLDERDVTGSLTVPATPSPWTPTSFAAGVHSLSAGAHTLRFVVDKAEPYPLSLFSLEWAPAP